MNFYQHHIGDYSKDTAHLSMLEDAAYRRMLDVYYATEKPLPKAKQAIYRLVRARTRQEQLAVDVVVGEFFTEGSDGWHNKRADEELSKARTETQDNSDRKENEAERQRRHRARRKQLFEALRQHGTVPKWDMATDALETQLKALQERNGNVPVTEPVTEPVTRTDTAIHKPLTNNHTTPLPPSGAFCRFWDSWLKSSRKASRGKCWQMWLKGGFDSHVEQIVAHVEAMKLSLDWRKDGGAFIPAPLVYLNQRRWEGADTSGAKDSTGPALYRREGVM